MALVLGFGDFGGGRGVLPGKKKDFFSFIYFLGATPLFFIKVGYSLRGWVASPFSYQKADIFWGFFQGGAQVAYGDSKISCLVYFNFWFLTLGKGRTPNFMLFSFVQLVYNRSISNKKQIILFPKTLDYGTSKSTIKKKNNFTKFLNFWMLELGFLSVGRGGGPPKKLPFCPFFLLPAGPLFSWRALLEGPL